MPARGGRIRLMQARKCFAGGMRRRPIVFILSVFGQPGFAMKPAIATVEQRSNAMKGRDIVPNEKECISQCIIKFWSGPGRSAANHDAQYERCLTNCNVCGSA